MTHMDGLLEWSAIFAGSHPLLSGQPAPPVVAPQERVPLTAARDLPEVPAVPLDQIGIWSNAQGVEATVFISGGITLARLEPTGIVLVEPRVFADHRGQFFETFHAEKFAVAGIPSHFVQDNHSLSYRHVLRGLHYQIQKAQGKLIRAIRGEVFDVAVDLRRASATFGRWFGTLLSAENRRMMYLPPGFAHGFCAYSAEAEVAYKCTDLYAPQFERTLLWNDPAVGIPWPVKEPIMAEKDLHGRLLADAECFE